jgi:hypothetical protein
MHIPVPIPTNRVNRGAFMTEYIDLAIRVSALIGFNYASWKAIDAMKEVLIYYEVI